MRENNISNPLISLITSKIYSFAKEHKLLFGFLIVYLIIRIILFNINHTEWGDTFRMIRSADYIWNYSIWPWDEKRWPLYSLLLVPGVAFNIPILWGRFLSLIISILIIVYAYFFYLRYFIGSISKFDKARNSQLGLGLPSGDGYSKSNTNKMYAVLVSALTATSSVFAYWSLRVMADPVFTLLVIAFLFYFIRRGNYYGSTILLKKAYINISLQSVYINTSLSLLLLCITMTRLEGLFLLFGVLFFLFFRKRFWELLLYLMPQVLIYIPWTLYAKFIYDGPVNNDYLEEAKGFVFDFARFEYFATYTLFILVIPILTYFVFYGLWIYLLPQFNNKNDKGKSKISPSSVKKKLFIVEWYSIGYQKLQNLETLPLFIFIGLEVLVGFVWTPSLPRIYTPIIPFLIMFAVLGIQRFDINKNRKSFLIWGIIFLIGFAALQYKLKLYFLGASKILFIGIILINVFVLVVSLNPILKTLQKLIYKKSAEDEKPGLVHQQRNQLYKWILISAFLFLNIVASFTIIHNQKDIYKSVNLAIEFLNSETNGVVAYSDETGNSAWYLRDRPHYLLQNSVVEPRVQYEYLKRNKAKYLLWTNEFNRGSMFDDPKTDCVSFQDKNILTPQEEIPLQLDSHVYSCDADCIGCYKLLYSREVEIYDYWNNLLFKLGIIENNDATRFVSKVYEVE